MAEAADGKLLRKFRILVVPLDWGLGHATRCIPVVKELLLNNCEVWLAGERLQENLLRSEFPELKFLPLHGYRIEFSKSNRGLLWKVIQQLPKIISAIRSEHRWLKKITGRHGFDAVISDNRFGLYHSKTPSVFITHQLLVKSKLGKWTEGILQRWNYRYINRFTECWIPDEAGDDNFAGELSHPVTKPLIPIRWVGLLSRFEREAANSFTLPVVNEDGHHLLFILSGPEPQRSILEDKIIDEVSHYPYTATIVRGLPSSLSVIPSTPMIKFYNHLPALELSEEIGKATWVISRSGYSTVMDVLAMQKKSILIPTPGQTEQEYLAQHLYKNRVAFTVNQKDFSLESALEQANCFDYRIPVNIERRIDKAVERFLRTLK